jgi:beta-glucosidase
VRTVLDGIRDRADRDGIRVDYARGADVLDPDPSGIPDAVSLALDADVVVAVVGDHLDQVGEECDRSELDLTGAQLLLLKALADTGKPLVVVLVNSKPLCIPWLAENANAIVEAFNPGMAGGDALAAILFGDQCPMGKLTVSFPNAIGEQPVYYQQIPGWHGSKHENYTTEPLYPFGFGLSYTRFRYSELELSPTALSKGQSIEVSVRVENVGGRRGTEIAQLYLNDLYTSLSTPLKTLRGFERVTLDPGQSQTLRFRLDFDALAFIGSALSRIVEPGEFEVLVGGSSRDTDLLRARFSYG